MAQAIWDTNVKSDNKYCWEKKLWGKTILSKFAYYLYLEINNLCLPIKCSECSEISCSRKIVLSLIAIIQI